MKKIFIENFKCFRSQEINFSNFTILVGGNGSGKSSVIQTLLLLRKTIEKKVASDTEVHISLNHDYALQLGLARNIFSSLAMTGEEIKFTTTNIDDESYTYSYSLNEDIDPLSLIGKTQFSANHNFPLKQTFRYLNAERQGPRRAQEMAPITDLNIGYYGEFTNHSIYYADKIKRSTHPKLQLEKESPRFSFQVEAWLKDIIPSTQFKVRTVEESGIAILEYRNEQLKTDFFNPPNTGFGITYSLPIIVGGLLASVEENPIFIVENPEAHLNPMGQSRIGAFLAILADSGVQVIVETHSEHVVNGARVQLAKIKETQKLLINYFSQDDNYIKVQTVESNEFGELKSWPPGFFDQERIDLRELIDNKLRGQNK